MFDLKSWIITKLFPNINKGIFIEITKTKKYYNNNYLKNLQLRPVGVYLLTLVALGQHVGRRQPELQHVPRL